MNGDSTLPCIQKIKDQISSPTNIKDVSFPRGSQTPLRQLEGTASQTTVISDDRTALFSLLISPGEKS